MGQLVKSAFLSYNKKVHSAIRQGSGMQLLRSLLKQISYESVRGDDDRKITDICCHSEKVKEGSLFVCINGYRNNGHEYVPHSV